MCPKGPIASLKWFCASELDMLNQTIFVILLIIELRLTTHYGSDNFMFIAAVNNMKYVIGY